MSVGAENRKCQVAKQSYVDSKITTTLFLEKRINASIYEGFGLLSLI